MIKSDKNLPIKHGNTGNINATKVDFSGTRGLEKNLNSKNDVIYGISKKDFTFEELNVNKSKFKPSPTMLIGGTCTTTSNGLWPELGPIFSKDWLKDHDAKWFDTDLLIDLFEEDLNPAAAEAMGYNNDDEINGILS